MGGSNAKTIPHQISDSKQAISTTHKFGYKDTTLHPSQGLAKR
jgi:hypothetical protein